jgi:hypothetical protein
VIRKSKRTDYLQLQRDRFQDKSHIPLPPNLHRVTIMGVDYIYGHVESTGGALWVVGRDPRLFDYFLPERWRKTPQVKLSETHMVFYTRTKDNVHLVWKSSRVGEVPEVRHGHPHKEDLIGHGYNSPFEEFAHAMDLNRRGQPTIMPRALYMTGPTNEPNDYITDHRRFQSHADLLTPDGKRILVPDHDYIKIWGFWNGPDVLVAAENGEFFECINLLEAVRGGLISEAQLMEIMDRTRARLAALGYESLDLNSHHILLSLHPSGLFLLDRDGQPEPRLCNFEFVRKLA